MSTDNSRVANPEVFRAILVKHEFTEAELRAYAGDDWPQIAEPVQEGARGGGADL